MNFHPTLSASPAAGKNDMVSNGHHLATEIGVELLRGRKASLLACAATATLIGLSTPAAAAATTPCELLFNVWLPQAAIMAAESIPAGTYTAPDGEVFAGLPAFCRVAATLTPTSDSNIKVELWMPATGWNKRYKGTGSGGYGGAIVYSALADGLSRGFAVANTDLGTAQNGTWSDGTNLIGHPEKVIDLNSRATHLMTVESKRIISAFYGEDAKFSYFMGCSRGGAQAAMEAQRFPDDYDGIVVGDSSQNLVHNFAAELGQFQIANETPASLVPQSKLTVLHNAIIAACNKQDGGLSTDTWLTDPRDCDFDPAALQCAGADAPTCLTAPQVETMQAIYDGTRNPRTNHLIYPGEPKGSEADGKLESNLAGPPTFFVTTFRWAFGPNWNPPFNFDSDMAEADQILGPIMNASNPDLSAFKQRRGKLIQYQGFADPWVVPQDMINYYESVVQAQRGNHPVPQASLGDKDAGHRLDGGALRETQEFFRLFMVPGMSHCQGGPGPNVFNQAGITGNPQDPDHDILSAMVKWVEVGDAPKKIVATKFMNDDPAQGVAFTRPICAYPEFPHYKGEGNPNDAASFVCRKDDSDYDPNQIAAPEYQYQPSNR